jgi:hypothetical protein
MARGGVWQASSSALRPQRPARPQGKPGVHPPLWRPGTLATRAARAEPKSWQLMRASTKVASSGRIWRVGRQGGDEVGMWTGDFEWQRPARWRPQWATQAANPGHANGRCACSGVRLAAGFNPVVETMTHSRRESAALPIHPREARNKAPPRGRRLVRANKGACIKPNFILVGRPTPYEAMYHLSWSSKGLVAGLDASFLGKSWRQGTWHCRPSARQPAVAKASKGGRASPAKRASDGGGESSRRGRARRGSAPPKHGSWAGSW